MTKSNEKAKKTHKSNSTQQKKVDNPGKRKELTVAEYLLVIEKYDQKIKPDAIAEEFGIGRSTVYGIIDRRHQYENHASSGGNVDIHRPLKFNEDGENTSTVKPL